jgi:hypothetical protein
MLIAYWIAENWFSLLQGIGIISSLIFTGLAFRRTDKSIRVENLNILTTRHRDIWAEYSSNPDLRRILKDDINLRRAPITRTEEKFLQALILHLSSSYEAIRNGLLDKPDGLERDIQNFFTKPMPRAMWLRSRPLQNKDFVDFVERTIDIKNEPLETR